MPSIFDQMHHMPSGDSDDPRDQPKGEWVPEEELIAVREQAALYMGYKDMSERLADALYARFPDHPLLRDEMWAERRKQRWEADPDETGMSPEVIELEVTEEEAAAYTAKLDAEAGGRREASEDHLGSVGVDDNSPPQIVRRKSLEIDYDEERAMRMERMDGEDRE